MLEFRFKYHMEENLERFLQDKKSLYLYGAGKKGEYFYEYLKRFNVRIDGVVVTQKNESELFHGIPVIALEDLRFSPEIGIIMSMNRDNQNEVKGHLLEKGFVNEQIFDKKDLFFWGGHKLHNEFQLTDLCESENSFFSCFSELETIGKKYGTDKCSMAHNYLNKYEFFLKNFRDKRVRVLELGVFRGASLSMWGEYFPKGEIYGVDVDQECLKYSRDNRKVIIGDLSEISVLDDLKKINPHILVDDASHMWSHQIKALFVLFEAVVPGGVYILEDLETNFRIYQDSGYDDIEISAYDILKIINEIVVSGEKFDFSQVPELKDYAEIIEKISADIELISFIHGSCIMVKK